MGVIEELQEIKREEGRLQREQASREADRRIAEKSRDEAMESLRSEFGVSTIEEAEAELTRREETFREEVRKAAAILKEVG